MADVLKKQVTTYECGDCQLDIPNSGACTLDVSGACTEVDVSSLRDLQKILNAAFPTSSFADDVPTKLHRQEEGSEEYDFEDLSVGLDEDPDEPVKPKPYQL